MVSHIHDILGHRIREFVFQVEGQIGVLRERRTKIGVGGAHLRVVLGIDDRRSLGCRPRRAVEGVNRIAVLGHRGAGHAEGSCRSIGCRLDRSDHRIEELAARYADRIAFHDDFLSVECWVYGAVQDIREAALCRQRFVVDDVVVVAVDFQRTRVTHVLRRGQRQVTVHVGTVHFADRGVGELIGLGIEFGDGRCRGVLVQPGISRSGTFHADQIADGIGSGRVGIGIDEDRPCAVVDEEAALVGRCDLSLHAERAGIGRCDDAHGRECGLRTLLGDRGDHHVGEFGCVAALADGEEVTGRGDLLTVQALVDLPLVGEGEAAGGRRGTVHLEVVIVAADRERTRQADEFDRRCGQVGVELAARHGLCRGEGEILGFLHERDLGRVAELHAAVVFRNGTLDLHYIA